MKKVSLILGFAFMASMVFAQNTAVVNQTGNEHKAKVAQTGDLNDATVDQSGGNKNYIDVVSTGIGNKVDVDQVGTLINSENASVYGYVHQDGPANDAKLDQQGTMIDFKIDQIGGRNVADVAQDGSWLQASDLGLKQTRTGSDRSAPGNYAMIRQTGTYQSLDVEQTGTGNSLKSNQSGNWNQFSAFQTGASNKAEITQRNTNNFDDWYNRANNKLIQTGDANEALITQNGDSKFLVTQEGNLNYAGLELTGSQAKVLQDGNSNYVGGMVDCVPTSTAILLAGSSLDATQLGDNNKLYVSTAGTLTVVQDNTGTAMVGNTIKYTQTAAGTVGLTQDGDKNLIWLKNTSSTVPMDVDVDQVGDGNTVASFVDGVATTCAIFAGAHLDVDQIGNLNSLNLDSQSAGASVDVLQQGNSNWASVVQGD